MSPPEPPTELLYAIISQIWSDPSLTPADRITFMTSSTLVSKLWSSLSDDLFSSDIHIPCESFYFHFFNNARRDFSRGRSITFTLPQKWPCGVKEGIFFATSPALYDMEKLVHLHTLNIVVRNRILFRDLGFFLEFPKYLPRLTVSYILSPDDVPKNFVPPVYDDIPWRYAIPRVGTLEVKGAPDKQFVRSWAIQFPEREKLISDGKEVLGMWSHKSSDYTMIDNLTHPMYETPSRMRNGWRKLEFGRVRSHVTHGDT